MLQKKNPHNAAKYIRIEMKILWLIIFFFLHCTFAIEYFSVPSFHEAAVLCLAALCTPMSLICLSHVWHQSPSTDPWQSLSCVIWDLILASDWSLAQNTGLWLADMTHTSPVSATVKAIKDRVVIRDIMWYTHSGGTWPKDTRDYILILHIFRICSAALIFAPAQFFVMSYQQLLELSWGEVWANLEISEPNTSLSLYPHAMALTLDAARKVHWLSDFQRVVLLGWPVNEWVLYDHHYLYNYIKF